MQGRTEHARPCQAPPSSAGHLLPDDVKHFDATVAGGGRKAPPIVVQLHVVHRTPVPRIEAGYGLRHARRCCTVRAHTGTPGQLTFRITPPPSEAIHASNFTACIRKPGIKEQQLKEVWKGVKQTIVVIKIDEEQARNSRGVTIRVAKSIGQESKW